MPSIERCISAYKAYKARKNKDNLIEQNMNCDNETKYEYDIATFNFDEETRIAKITFKIIKKYKTIERYVTRNYQRYPIYSDWKTKVSFINKKIKLTNTELENLWINNDDLISKFSTAIITLLNKEELKPSWYLKNMINDIKKKSLKESELQKNNIINEHNAEIEKENNNLKDLKNKLTEYINNKNRETKKLSKLDIKLNKIYNYKKSVFLTIITFYIYNALNSKKRKNKIKEKINKIDLIIQTIDNNILNINLAINKKISNIENLKISLNQKIDENEKQKNKIIEFYDNKLKNVKVLNSSYEIDYSDFIPLKNFIGYDYKKIIGCYVICNTEKDKYYVGQSKDVMKRIKQHFKGTIPNNIIFAEDYYSSSLKNKNDLFKVKIIEFTTKDELDKNEKLLIDKYNSNIAGYNSTKGNT